MVITRLFSFIQHKLTNNIKPMSLYTFPNKKTHNIAVIKIIIGLYKPTRASLDFNLVRIRFSH